jgi:heptosyltransferase-2
LAEHVEIIQLGIECSPCFERTCRFGHYNCLRLLEPKPVVEALERLGGTPVEVS